MTKINSDLVVLERAQDVVTVKLADCLTCGSVGSSVECRGLYQIYYLT